MFKLFEPNKIFKITSKAPKYVLFLFIVVKTVFAGKKATPQVWDGADGLEWTVDSPAPYHTFDIPPKVK